MIVGKIAKHLLHNITSNVSRRVKAHLSDSHTPLTPQPIGLKGTPQTRLTITRATHNTISKIEIEQARMKMRTQRLIAILTTTKKTHPRQLNQAPRLASRQLRKMPELEMVLQKKTPSGLTKALQKTLEIGVIK